MGKYRVHFSKHCLARFKGKKNNFMIHFFTLSPRFIDNDKEGSGIKVDRNMDRNKLFFLVDSVTAAIREDIFSTACLCVRNL